MRNMGVGLRGLTKYNIGVGTLEERYLRRWETMERYREKRNLAVRRRKNTMCSQTILSEGSIVHFEHNLSTTGPYAAILIKGSLKEGPR